MTNQIDKAIAEAEAQVANKKANGPSLDLVPAGTSQGQVQTYAAAKAPSLDDLMTGSMNVDGYLKVKDNTLLIDNKPNLIETVKVTIDLSEVQAYTGVKFGNPVVYLKTYDGVTAASGGSWPQALEKAQRVDASVRPYMGADIPMTLSEPALDLKGAEVAKAGVRLGHSTSTTNRNELASFLKACKEAGLDGQKVAAEIGFKKMTNPKGQSWGILTFKLIGSAETGE